MSFIDGVVSTLFNHIPMTKIRADMKQFGHAVVIHAAKAGAETQYVIWREKDGILYGRNWDSLDGGTIGQETIDPSKGIITHLPTVDKTLPEVERKVRAAIDTLMYDQELRVFLGDDQKFYCITRNANVNASGFTAYEQDTGSQVFFEWSTLALYRGTWLPDGSDFPDCFVTKKNFTYCSWMKEHVSDQSLIPPSPKRPAAPDTTFEDLIRRVEELERMVSSLMVKEDQ